MFSEILWDQVKESNIGEGNYANPPVLSEARQVADRLTRKMVI
jgi:hypothetical protein